MKKKSQAGCEPKPERSVQEGEGKEEGIQEGEGKEPEEGIQEGEGKEQERKKEYRKVNKAGKSVDM